MFAALASTTVSAETNYFLDYGSTVLQEGGAAAVTDLWSGTTGTWTLGSGSVGLSFSGGSGSTEATLGKITVDLSLQSSTDAQTAYLTGLQLGQNTNPVSVLSILAGTDGTKITGPINISTGKTPLNLKQEGLTSLPTGFSVLTLGASGDSGTVTNEGAVMVNVGITGGIALTGTVIEGTYVGNQSESYTYSSDLGATAVTITKSGTWNNTFGAVAASTGGQGDGKTGDAIAVSIGNSGSGTWKAPAKGTATFTASATSSGLSQNATALSVGTGGTLALGQNLGITMTANLTTAAQGEVELTEAGYTSTSVSFTSSEAGYIGSAQDNEGSLNTGSLVINSELTVATPTDLATKVTAGSAITATAYGINQTGGGALNVLAGSVANNAITATVKQGGGALNVDGAKANAFAVTASGKGALNITLADPEDLKEGTASDAVLNIQANTEGVFFATTAPTGTTTAAAVYAQGGSSEVGTITIDAQSGTINISAIAAEATGSQAYGVWAGGDTNNGSVVLQGNTLTVKAEGGAPNTIFVETPTAADPYALEEEIKINNAAIYADGNGEATKGGTVAVKAKNLTVTGDVIAISNETGYENPGKITFDNAQDGTTTSIINGDVYALNGGSIVVGADTGDTSASGADAVTVTGTTYILGEASTASSEVTVNAAATYTAQGETIVANGGYLNLNGGSYVAQGAVYVGAPGESAESNGIVVGGDDVGGTMTAYSTTTITKGGTLELKGATGDGNAATYTALGDVTIAELVAPVEGALTVDTATVTIGEYGTLNIGDATHTGVTATVN